MGRRLSIEIEEYDRGNLVRVRHEDGKKAGLEGEIIEGQQGSVNLRDRTRRRVGEIVAAWYPADRNVPTT